MDKERRAKRQLQGILAHASGRQFEEGLDQAFAWYRSQGLADIQKTPEPMRVVKNLGNGKFVAFFEKKAQADYSGVMRGGHPVAIEAKFTSGDRIEQSRVSEEQGRFLTQREELGSWCYVLAGFSTGNVYRVPWAIWQDMKSIFGHKYVTEGDLVRSRVPIRAGMPMVLEDLV